MVKKGVIEEILSKARFVDDPNDYRIIYRDFEKWIEKSLPDFIRESDNFQVIPVTRIEMIKKNNTVLFEKTRPEAK
ncbi:MAG: DUF504 domain-containing protein [Nitrosopumilaceae archaeon]|nr:DUF504 domain-containing protein [Nitrosopumilaceae archaeon]